MALRIHRASTTPETPENLRLHGPNRDLPTSPNPQVPEAPTEPPTASRKKVIVIKKGVKTVDGVPVVMETDMAQMRLDPEALPDSAIWGSPKVQNLTRRRNNLMPVGKALVDAMQAAARRCNLRNFDPHIFAHRHEMYLDLWLHLSYPGREIEMLRTLGKARVKTEASSYILEYYGELVKIL